MLPHHHFLLTGLVISPIALSMNPGPSAVETLEWIVIGGIASACVDMDILVLVIARSREHWRLRAFRNPVSIFRRFPLFMEIIARTGILSTGLKTHIVMSAALMGACILAFREYAIPVMIGIASHILSDLQYLPRLKAGSMME